MNRIKLLRICTALLGIGVVVSGVAGQFYYGGLDSLHLGDIWATCPLGYLERSLAVGALLPGWAFAALALITVVILGRVFCAWICPTVLLRRVFFDKGELNGSPRAASNGKSGAANGSPVALNNPPAASNGARAAAKNTKVALNEPQSASNGTGWASYSSYAVLGGVLVASFLFKFPLFCFFCPIGLVFGAVYAGVRYFSLDSFGLELFLFPAILVLELYVLKSWCRSICPLGALLSLAGNFNHFLIPAPNKEKCFKSKGVDCKVCSRACPEGIDLAKIGKGFAPNSCTKCLECYVKCPTKAIKFPLMS